MSSSASKSNKLPWFLACFFAALALVLLVMNIKQGQAYQEQFAAKIARASMESRPRVIPPAPKVPSQNLSALSPQEAAARQAKLESLRGPMGISIDKSIRIKDPYAPELKRKGLARGVERMMGPLVAGLELPTDKAVKLKNLLVERRLAFEDARIVAEKLKLTDRASIAEAEAVAFAPVDAQMEELLGRELSERVKTMLNVLDEYNSLQNWVGLDMSFAGVPLKPDQALALASMMKELSYLPIPSAASVRMTALANPGVDVREEVLNRAAQILSPQQMEIFRVNQDEKYKEEALRLSEIRSMKTVAGRP